MIKSEIKIYMNILIYLLNKIVELLYNFILYNGRNFSEINWTTWNCLIFMQIKFFTVLLCIKEKF